MTAAVPEPPRPARRPHRLEAHGDVRVDDWYWLGDRDDPAVLEHLEAENAYTEAALGPLAPLRAALFEEMRARIVETDLSVPVRRGPFWYYERTVEGSSYAIHCRCPATGDDPPDAVGPLPDEEVLLDENQLAEGHEYLAVGNLVVSPDHRFLAYAIDITGAERFALRFRALDPGAEGAGPGEVVPDTYYGLAWANDNATVFYTKVDEAMRPYQLWRHRLGTDPGTDRVVAEELDERFTLGVGRTKDDAFVLVVRRSTTTTECAVIPADDPAAIPRVIEPRRPGHEYSVEHYPGPVGRPGWWLVLTNDDARDFRLMVAPADCPSLSALWRPVVPERPGTRLDDVDACAGRVIVSERLAGEARLRVVPLAEGDDPFAGDRLAASWLVASDEHPATTWEGANPEFASSSLRYAQTSLVTPRTVLDLDLKSGVPTLRKRQPVLGGFDPAAYRTVRLWATAEDGTEVPLSVVWRAQPNADPVTGRPFDPSPCLLYGYGAYEISIDPVFSSLRLSLLDRGVVFAIAHVRGGGELGRRWYEDGKLLNKPHSFGDFVACARHLVDAGFTAPDRLAARGGSAGGLLMGAVLNAAPDLFSAVVAEVPFVDCLTTMLDASLPLTVGEWEEWGNPEADEAVYRVMKGYSPYDNVPSARPGGPAVALPTVLATAGLHDNRVGYWEPAKWVAKLRESNPRVKVLLKTELGAGHGGPSGRYDAWRDEALVVAFLLEVFGLAET